MSDFKAKMHQIRFRLGICPRPRWGSLQRSQDPQLDLRGLLLRGGEERGADGRGRDARSVCLLILTILATGLAQCGLQHQGALWGPGMKE